MFIFVAKCSTACAGVATSVAVARHLKNHWGEWVMERGHLVGFKRKMDFARAVGCSTQHLARLAKMPTPPARMRRGLDRTLARALKTTRDVLFSEYKNIAPEATARVMFHPDHVYPLPTNPAETLFWPMANVLSEIVPRLDQDEVSKGAEYLIQLVLSKNDERRAEFENLRDRAIWESDNPRRMFTPEDQEKAIRKYRRQK